LRLIKLPPVASAFLLLNDGVGALQKATDAGTAVAFSLLFYWASFSA